MSGRMWRTVTGRRTSGSSGSAPSLASTPYWIPSRSVSACYECETPFSLTLRRHHCRTCGRIFCHHCMRRLLPKTGERKGRRVCTFCFAEHFQSNNDDASLTQPSDPSANDPESSSPDPHCANADSTENLTSDETASPYFANTPLYTTADPTASTDSPNGAEPAVAPSPADAPDDSDAEGAFASVASTCTDFDTAEAVDRPASPPPPPVDQVDKRARVGDTSSDGNLSDADIRPVSPGIELNAPRESASSIADESESTPKHHRNGSSEHVVDPSTRTGHRESTLSDQDRGDVVPGDVPKPSKRCVSPGEGRTHRFDSHRPRRQAPPDSLAAPVPDDVLDHGTEIWRPPQDFPSDKAESLTAALHERAESIGAAHLRSVVEVMLRENELQSAQQWAAIAARIAHEAAKSVSPQVAEPWRMSSRDSSAPLSDVGKSSGTGRPSSPTRGSSDGSSLSAMDIMEHVKIKRIPAGGPEHSRLVKGVVFRKNVAHRRMPQFKENCRVAVIRGALEYQRSEGRLSSLDTLLEQEREHLRIGVTRIKACNPDVVLVERTVARHAQELLLEAGITLVLNVKSHVLERICRTTGAQKASAFDLAPEQLGYCGRFRIEYVQQEYPIFGISRPLMFFEECSPMYGVTVLLYGDKWDVIKSVKSILGLAITQARHLQLESAYLADELATEALCNQDPQSALLETLEASAKAVRERNAEMVGDSVASCSPHVTLSEMSYSGRLPQSIHGINSLLQHQQRLLVSIASRNFKTGMLCEPHTVRRVEHYGSTDMQLGSFMEAALPGTGRYCVNPGCAYKPEAHVRTYLHGKGRIALRVRHAPRGIKAHARNKGGMWLWSRCLRCDKLATQGDEHAKRMQASRRKVLLSEEAKAISFGRFIELTLAGSELRSSCGHSLHRDHVRFLACEQGVACLQYQTVVPLAVHIPQTPLQLDTKSQRDHMDNERTTLVEETQELFASIERNLKSLWRWELFSAGVNENRNDEKSNNTEGRRRYDEQLSALGREREDFMQHLHDETQQENAQDVSIGQVNRLRQGVMETSRRWNKRVHELHHQRHFALDSKQVQMTPPLQKKERNAQDAQKAGCGKLASEEQLKASTAASGESQTQAHRKLERERSGDRSGTSRAVPESSSTEPQSCASSTHQQSSASKVHGKDGGSGSLRSIGLRRMSSGASFSFASGEGSSRPASSGGARQKAGENDKSANPQLGVWTPSGRSHMSGTGSEAEDSVVVYDDEPTTIVAMALQSESFKKQMREHNSQLGWIEQVGNKERERHSKRHADMSSTESEKPEIGAGPEECHIKHTFDLDSAQGEVKARYNVTAYYAAQFNGLRQLLLGGDDPFIASLCRSRKWDTNGGKSNAYFAKTLDDRFVVKQLSRTELSSFLEFGPAYFKYMASSLKNGAPVALAKLIGVFNVVLRVPKQNGSYREDRLNFVVQENLFYGRSISSVYDLKGSLRSRYNDAKDTGVLLDENLVETLSRAPLLVQERSKQQLEAAVWNGSSFLASLGVMDYSLLVGIDEERRELVVGLIDFIRQYTWDKQLETYVKQSGVFGGGGKEPTIVSPKQYKKRFCKAMNRYFVLVPEVQSRSQSIHYSPTGEDIDRELQQEEEAEESHRAEASSESALSAATAEGQPHHEERMEQSCANGNGR